MHVIFLNYHNIRLYTTIFLKIYFWYNIYQNYKSVYCPKTHQDLYKSNLFQMNIIYIVGKLNNWTGTSKIYKFAFVCV